MREHHPCRRAALLQPAQCDPSHQAAGKRAWLSAVFQDQPRRTADTGGGTALCPCRARHGSPGGCPAGAYHGTGAAKRHTLHRCQRGGSAVPAAAGAEAVPAALSGGANPCIQPLHAPGHCRASGRSGGLCTGDDALGAWKGHGSANTENRAGGSDLRTRAELPGHPVAGGPVPVSPGLPGPGHHELPVLRGMVPQALPPLPARH